jgi:magnesium-transporting ATPase (P-type)
VIATGDATELGDLAASLQRGSALSTPLTRKFGRFSVTVLRFVLGLSILNALVGLARGGSGAEMFDAAVALAVSAIPEELIEANLTFLGLQGMADPPRPEATRAVAACRAEGRSSPWCSLGWPI